MNICVGLLQFRRSWFSRAFAMSERSAGIALRDLRMRPVAGAVERAAWDHLMEAHHCLGFRSPFGTALRHAAELPEGEGAALLGRSAGSFKVEARDRWLGWAPEQQFRRLHLIACNARFLVLPGFRVANLASRFWGFRCAGCLQTWRRSRGIRFCWRRRSWIRPGSRGRAAVRRAGRRLGRSGASPDNNFKIALDSAQCRDKRIAPQ